MALALPPSGWPSRVRHRPAFRLQNPLKVWVRIPLLTSQALGFPRGSAEKNAYNAGDLGLIPGLGRFPGEGNGNPLQYSCLEDPTDRGAWLATLPKEGAWKPWLPVSFLPLIPGKVKNYDCTTVWMYLMPIIVYFQIVKMLKFMLCLFYYNKNNILMEGAERKQIYSGTAKWEILQNASCLTHVNDAFMVQEKNLPVSNCLQHIHNPAFVCQVSPSITIKGPFVLHYLFTVYFLPPWRQCLTC